MTARAVPLAIAALRPGDWGDVARIYADGIATGDATFETEVPDWEEWDRSPPARPSPHRRDGRRGRVGWAALTPVSGRCVYAGVAEVSVYVAADARGHGVGAALLAALVASAEAGGPVDAAGRDLPREHGQRAAARAGRIPAGRPPRAARPAARRVARRAPAGAAQPGGRRRWRRSAGARPRAARPRSSAGASTRSTARCATCCWPTRARFAGSGRRTRAYSALVRDTLRRGHRFDRDLALRQHAEMVDAFREAGRRGAPARGPRRARLRRLHARLELHDAVGRRRLPARQPAPARRVRHHASLLRRARHPDLRPGLGRELRGRRLQH